MLCAAKKVLIVLIAVAFVLTGPAAKELAGIGAGNGYVHAAVGSLNEGEDVTLDKAGGLLKSLGFDTSEMPSTYDADATTNPYGSDVTTLNEIEEYVKFIKLENDPSHGNIPTALLFGHNTNLDGEFQTFESDPKKDEEKVDFLADWPFSSAAKCDITGNGRDGAVALLYTGYDFTDGNSDKNIYMRLYDPKTTQRSDPFTIGPVIGTGENDKLPADYLVQSQIQITAGDYDKDSIDEIAVYVPAKNSTSRAKVTIFDLTDGKDCANPYAKASWREAWNYMLPVSDSEIISVGNYPDQGPFVRNVYNNIDLTSGDADNDGICDLIVSYGASDTEATIDVGHTDNPGNTVRRSIPSTSVLLYGSDQGQMLKDSQQLSYGDNPLIRVAFAFGDVNGDGNEDMFIGGQLQSEQSSNTSRVLGMYHYDDQDGMQLENIKNMQVVNGSYNSNTHKFYSQNGWDGEYRSVPLMKTNIAVGDVMGEDSSTKIYMDSVLYSVEDGDFSIVDELEDPSEDDSGNPLGSRIFTLKNPDGDMKGYNDNTNLPARYYEFGADTGNFTGGFNDYMITERVSMDKKSIESIQMNHKEAISSMIILDGNEDNAKLKDARQGHIYYDEYYNATPFMGTTVDSDKDSMVATYTGEHDINYKDPELLAVLMSPPYYKDVAAYDGNDMLNYCGTSYGKTTGHTVGESHSFDSRLGAYLNIEIGAKEGTRFVANAGFGWARSETWGYEEDLEYEISYSTVGGEDAVVLYSTPSENYMYDLEGVTVDDDGKWDTFHQLMAISKDHKAVKQVLTLEEYNKIQKRNKDDLPDVTKFVTSEAGYPKTYPKSSSDIPDEAKNKLDKNSSNEKNGYRVGDDWSGISYGGGTETQSFRYSKESRDRYENAENGTYATVDLGVNNVFGIIGYWQGLGGGVHFEYSQTGGSTASTIEGHDCSGTVVNMPMAAKGYGYDFSWKLFNYDIKYKSGDKTFEFPVVTYIVADAVSPPELPDNIVQDFDQTTDSELALTWDYSAGGPKEFRVYRYEDFPIGGGDTLVGTVAGGTYRIKKDENGNTVKDKRGRVVHEYTFKDKDLTADTRYQYRLKVIGTTNPKESIYSPVVEGRTFVGTKPKISLSTDKLTIYPDGTYDLLTKLEDPENYQSNISYQWQKYDEKKRKWTDLEGRTRAKLHFYECEEDDAGLYRCRMNLIRKVEGHPQYISAYTESCTVTYSLRSVKFGPINVYDGTGQANTNTGLYVDVFNKSESSDAKPVGSVVFTITGPNGSFKVVGQVDESTGRANVPSIEDRIGTIGQKNFVDGGYVITARYMGSAVFYPEDDPEEYHYLRNIDECLFLSTESVYFFGEDMADTMYLYDYKRDPSGKVSRTDHTDEIKCIKFYKADDDGKKTGDPVETIKLSDTDGKVRVPLHADLSKQAFVEAYTNEDGSGDAAASTLIKTKKIGIRIAVNDKMTGTGELLEFIGIDDVDINADIDVDPKEKNIPVDGGTKSLSDYMRYKYYEQNGEFMYNSDDAASHKDEFIPADYKVQPTFNDDHVKTFYSPVFAGGRFTVVGNYYLVSASAKDPNTGSVEMISPDKVRDFTDRGYAGGTKLTLKADPVKGFKVEKWIIDECGQRTYTLPGDERIDYTVKSQNTDGDGKVTIKAVMEPKDNTLVFEAKGQGTISLEPAGISSGDVVLAETKLNFTATPEPGWRFDEWRWTNVGGNNVISGGVEQEDGTNKKTFTMPDNSAVLYGVFKRDTIDVIAPDTVDVYYINDGSDPLREIGEEILTDRGKDVPKGVTVLVKLKPGYELAPNSEWSSVATTPEGMYDLPVTTIVSGGRDGCKFDLPVDVTSCKVSIETQKGRYSVRAADRYDRATFTIYVDGNPMSGNPVTDIEAGSQIDIKARSERGHVIKSWNANGEFVEVNDYTYSTVLTQNTDLETESERDQSIDLTLKAEGGGKGKYVITDKNGDPHEGTFEGPEGTTVSPGPYFGEALTVSAADDESAYTMTAITVNGVEKELDEGSFSIDELREDTEIVCRFRPNAYMNVEFTKDMREYEPLVLDEDDSEIEFGKTVKVAKNDTLKFSVIIDRRARCVVEKKTDQKDRLTPVSGPVDYDEDRVKYEYEVADVDENAEIIVSDHEIMYIYDEDDLKEYLEALAEYDDRPYMQPDGVLMADIEATHYVYTNTPSSSKTRFDGQGHYVYGLTVGSETDPVDPFQGVFGDLLPGSFIKDVCFRGISVYAVAGTDLYSGMLTHVNQGTISQVAVIESTYRVWKSTSSSRVEQAACFAMNNHGTIENCLVKDVLIDNREREDNNQGTACGIAVFNQMNNDGISGDGVIKGNYVEGLQYTAGGSSDPKDAIHSLIILDGSDKHRGTVDNESNIYKQSYDVTCDHGKNAFKLTDKPDDRQKAEAEAATAEFSRKVEWYLNDLCGEKIWGVVSDSDAFIRQLAVNIGDNKEAKAPIKVFFTSEDPTFVKYYFPGECDLPDLPGTPYKYVGWNVGDIAYEPPAKVTLLEDQVIEATRNPDEYVAILMNRYPNGDPTDEPFNIRLYKDLMEAIKDAEKDPGLFLQELNIRRPATMEEYEFIVSDKTTITTTDTSNLTMKTGATIINNGTIRFGNLSGTGQVHKYGTIVNYGKIRIPINCVYNYGSVFDNMEGGVIDDRSRIICKPHRTTDWEWAPEPEDDGRWKKTSTCTVCGNEVEDYIDPNPPINKVEYLELVREPDKTTYEVGEEFTDEGMIVYAHMTDGSRAVVTDYEMTLEMEDMDVKALKNGDALNDLGDGVVSVIYGTCEVPFMIGVIDTKDLLTIRDAEGNEISETETEPGDEFQLFAQLKNKLPYRTTFTWETDNANIASLEETTGKTNFVTTGEPGTATITVTVVDENGNPVTTIDPKTVTVRNVSHVTDLKIKGGDVHVEKGDTYQMQAVVTPVNTTDEIKWWSSDEEVFEIDQDGLITAVAGGEALVTVQAGELVDSRKVFVYEKARELELEPEMLEVDVGGYSSISARVLSAKANGEITWTVDDPETCGFFVKNEETGEMEVVDTVTTKLSGDGSGTSDAYIVIKGVKEGAATVTASTDSEAGGTIEKTCEITVRDDPDDWVRITHNGAALSGETLMLDLGNGTVMLGADSSFEGDEFIWTTIDDEKDPVIKLNADKTDSSKCRVTPKRPGLAVVQLTSNNTGKTDVCMIKVRIKPDGVMLSETELEMKEGTKHELIATLTPEGAEGEIKWTSSDESIATVSKTGEVTAVSPGNVVITAAPDDPEAETAECRVKVYEEPVVVTLPVKNLMLTKGETMGITATVTPSDAKGEVIWTSSDESVATVSNDGLITAVGGGTATITASFSKKGSTPATCEVTVYDDPDIPVVTLSKNELLLKRGKKATLKAKVTPADAEGKIVWSSANKAIATVNQNGVVKGVRPGAVTITATFTKTGSIAATCRVDVYQKKLTVKLSKKKYVYNRTRKLPKVTVKSGKVVLAKNIKKSNDNVTLLFEGQNHNLPGKFKVIAIARDWHYGTGETKYEVRLKPTKLKKLKSPKKGQLDIKWKKVSRKYVSGYRIRFCKTKNMDDARYKLIKGVKNTSRTIKGLKSGQKYYVQVRTYVRKRGIFHYSKWSKARAVTVK